MQQTFPVSEDDFARALGIEGAPDDLVATRYQQFVDLVTERTLLDLCEQLQPQRQAALEEKLAAGEDLHEALEAINAFQHSAHGSLFGALTSTAQGYLAEFRGLSKAPKHAAI